MWQLALSAVMVSLSVTLGQRYIREQSDRELRALHAEIRQLDNLLVSRGQAAPRQPPPDPADVAWSNSLRETDELIERINAELESSVSSDVSPA